MPSIWKRHRIVAHGSSSEHGRYYDMLRTQVLQEMDKKSWQFLAVTSPTAGCGKTVTACNLAMSISRLPERSVLLVDLDLRKPTVANYLGIEGNGGVLSVLEGRATLRRRSCRQASVRTSFLVLPGTVSYAGFFRMDGFANDGHAAADHQARIQVAHRDIRPAADAAWATM